jgi:hypothetical protein
MTLNFIGTDQDGPYSVEMFITEIHVRSIDAVSFS